MPLVSARMVVAVAEGAILAAHLPPNLRQQPRGESPVGRAATAVGARSRRSGTGDAVPGLGAATKSPPGAAAIPWTASIWLDRFVAHRRRWSASISCLRLALEPNRGCRSTRFSSPGRLAFLSCWMVSRTVLDVRSAAPNSGGRFDGFGPFREPVSHMKERHSGTPAESDATRLSIWSLFGLPTWVRT